MKSCLEWYQSGTAVQPFGDNSTDTVLGGDQWSATHEEVIKQCNKLVGAKDGIPEDTRKYKLDLTPLSCNIPNVSTSHLSNARTQLSRKSTPH
jgi:hypothetical protein